MKILFFFHVKISILFRTMYMVINSKLLYVKLSRFLLQEKDPFILGPCLLEVDQYWVWVQHLNTPSLYMLVLLATISRLHFYVILVFFTSSYTLSFFPYILNFHFLWPCFIQEGTAPLNLYVEDEFSRASRGGAGGVKSITNYAPVYKLFLIFVV